ncbi:hypothetical protein GCM10010260_49290 [Streptomyces filipinensis]|uniref:FtsK domain-containing protein n=1 Tax=Streptomyces filipinensis TaxID=66887 RepID=A0A918MDF1_9ACTN|nr:hypothetical protein GCM10010260_49290 [Streptomyces filipinensis]
MTVLPSLTEVVREHKVSRGVAVRAFGVLKQEGVAEPAPGERWRVVRAGAQADRRPLHERIAEVITADGLEVGEAFPSASALAARFDVSRPTVTKALEKLEAAGVLAGGGQGSAGHGPVTGALSATTGAFAVATTAATAMPPGWALAVGAAGALGHTIAGLRVRNAGRTLATRAASWLIGAGWTTWAMTHGPLTWAALGSLATVGVGICAAARSVALYEEAREEEAIAAEQRAIARELSAERRPIAEQWVERIQRICSISVRVLAVEMWPTGTGYSLDLEPQGGITYDRIAQYSVALSADAKLPHGCTATACAGIHQGRVILDVTTVNVLSEDCPYPDDYGPLSVLTGLPWGVRTNADVVPVYLREQCALVVGPTGSGKTNLVHTILAGFARAQDVLTWVIDLNAGSAGLPWVLPALNGELQREDGLPVRPGIDRLAGSYDEAMLMLDAALAIGLHRKRAYQDLLAKANTDLLPVSARIPQIILVIDEGAEILVSTDREMKQLAKKILEVIRMLRAMGIRTVLTVLGATGSVLGNLMIRREAKVRVALTGGETEGMDLGRMFPGRRGLRVEQAPLQGVGVHGHPGVAGRAVQGLADPAQPDPGHHGRHLRPASLPGRHLRQGRRARLRPPLGRRTDRVDARPHPRRPHRPRPRAIGIRWGRAEPVGATRPSDAGVAGG